MAKLGMVMPGIYRFSAIFLKLILCGVWIFQLPQVIAGSLASVTPMGASTGYPIQITGTGFNSTASNNEVSFIHSSGTAVKANATAITLIDSSRQVFRLTVNVPVAPIGTTALSVRNTATNEISNGTSIQVIKLSLPDKNTGTQGESNLNIRITGTPNTQFVSGNTRAVFGTGITVNSTTVESPTSVVANITISASAAVGARQIGVITRTQSAVLPNVFFVTGPLAVGAQATPLSGTPPLNVSFSSTVSGGKLPYSITWNFGDNTAQTSQANPVHQYTKAGNYTASLTVTDNNKTVITKSFAVSVTAVKNPMTISAAATPTNGIAPLSVNFSSSASGGSGTYSYDWDFGDGTARSTLPNPVHIYTSGNRFTPTLTIRDGTSAQSTSLVISTNSSTPSKNSQLVSDLLTVTKPHYGSGWATDHWIPNQQKVLVWGGQSHNPNGENSVQLFNPVTRAYEMVQASNGGMWDRGLMQFVDGIAALTNRDNHYSLYVPKRNEYWVFDGSPSSGIINPEKKDQLTGHFGGIFSLNENKWVKIAYNPTEFAKNLIANFGQYFYSPNIAHIWNEALDTGVFYGSDKDGRVAAFNLIEPNPSGPEPYRLNIVPVGHLTAVWYCRNCIVSVGEYVYIYGGTTRAGDLISDLVRFHIPTRSAVKLASGPRGLVYPVVTYDSKRNKIVVFGGSKSNHLFIYDVATNTWKDRTGEVTLPYVHNGSGVYSPVTDEHIYRGGNYFDAQGNEMDWQAAYQMWSLKLEDSSADQPSTEPAPTPDPVPTTPGGTWQIRKTPAFLTQMKHAHFATGDDGLLYMHGGDYAGTGGQSYQQGLYTYDVVKDKWTQVYPYITPAGETQPQRPDQMGWTWDSKRKGFWSLPGYQFNDNGMDTNATIGKAMFFNPKTRKWAVPPGQNELVSFNWQNEIKNAVYDEVTDSVYQLGYNEVRIFDTNTNQFRAVRAANFCSGGYSAKVGRDIYCLDDQKGNKLYRFNIDSRTVEATDLPFIAANEKANILFDECKNQLLVPIFAGYDLPDEAGYNYIQAQLWVYPLATKVWEQRNVPAGKPRGREAAFHTPSCKMMIIGGSEPANDQLYLYTP